MSKLPKEPSSSPTPPDYPSGENFNNRTANVETLRKLSTLLDNAFQVPGTSIGVGIDPLLGLLPGGGDFIGGLLSIYIVYSAARMGAPKETLVRMASNIVFDSLAGTVPVVGDLFDVAWKANVKNIDLLETHLASPTKSKKANRWFVYLMLAALVFLVIGISVVGVLIIGLFVKALYAMFGG
ncbi:MAG: DUF4112 domain-containing protein [Okeania sp. SIO2H7]|nr:DUF4112 domain-containing protein [Okeania sp. SIO2H7]